MCSLAMSAVCTAAIHCACYELANAFAVILMHCCKMILLPVLY